MADAISNPPIPVENPSVPSGKPELSPQKSKKVVLKVKVGEDYNFEPVQRGAAPSTPNATPVRTPKTATAARSTRKIGSRSKAATATATARRSRRGRPRNASLVAAVRAHARALQGENQGQNVDGDGSEGFDGRGEPCHVPSVEFRFLSDYSFPMLVYTGDISTGDNSLAVRHPPVPVKQCASCDIVGAVPSLPVSPLPGNDSLNNPLQTNPHSQPSRHKTGEVSLSAKPVVATGRSGPNTLAFWYDVTIAGQARASINLDFKMLCLHMIWDRDKGDLSGSEIVVRDERSVVWDMMLDNLVAKGKAWRKRRKRVAIESEKAADWAVWEERVRRRSRGRFVEDIKGAWLLRAPGLDGGVTKILPLGYKRAGSECDRNAG